MALAMRKLGLAEEVIGVGRKVPNLKDALRLGAITSYQQNVKEAVAEADLVVFAVPVRAMPALAKQIQGRLKPAAIVMDVGSTKANLIKKLEPLLDPEVDFVPTHPIAGKEKSGARFADPELFKDRWTIITPCKRSSPEGINRVQKLWKSLGAKVELMDAQLHDRILAGVSHLPHLVAYSLVGALLAMDQKAPMLKFSAGGFRDFTRIAESSPEMWRDICLENKTEILRAVQEYEKQLGKIKKWLKAEKGRELEKFFARCKAVKERIKTNG